MNTESLEGVCIKHSDDCTPLCMPRGDDPTQRKVCTKGCNQLVKVKKVFAKGEEPETANESKLYDIVVCQGDKRIVCSKPSAGSDRQQTSCSEKKWIDPTAICAFSIDLWNLGGTCIENHLRNTPGEIKDCPFILSSGMIAGITQNCRVPDPAKDATVCASLALTF